MPFTSYYPNKILLTVMDDLMHNHVINIVLMVRTNDDLCFDSNIHSQFDIKMSRSISM